MRDMCPLAEKMRSMPPLFKFFLDGSRRVYKVDDIQYDKKVFPIVSGQISVSCCAREMNDDNTFRSFGKVFEEAYPVVCLPKNMSCRITRLCKNRNYFRENNNQTRFYPINRNPGLGRKARDSFTTAVLITPAGANRRRSPPRKPSVRGRIWR